MEYVLKNKKKDMYMGKNNKLENVKENAIIFNRKDASEQLKKLSNPEEWELSVIRTSTKLTEDEKIMNIIHNNHKKEYDKIIKSYKKKKRNTTIFFGISLIFFLFSLGYFIWVVINYVR